MKDYLIIGAVALLFLTFATIKIIDAGRDAERFMKMLDIQQEKEEV